MTEESLPQQLIGLQRLLTEVDARLMKAPVTPVGLDDLKASVDSLRTNIWAIMSAGKGTMSPTTVHRFKLRRSADMLRDLVEEFDQHPNDERFPEHTALADVAQGLVTRLGRK